MLTQSIEVPAFVLESRFVRKMRGFAVLDQFPPATVLAELRAEAWAAYDTADRQECEFDDGEEVRGGMPRRRLYSAGAGPAQDALYHDRTLAAQLSELCGMTVSASGSRGSYSYYMSAGDCLDLHRDVDTCDLTLITCLHDATDPQSPSGALVVYPDHLQEPLSSIRDADGSGGMVLKLMAGQTIALLGGMVPHQVLPVQEGQARVISALCFRVGPACVPCEAARRR